MRGLAGTARTITSAALAGPDVKDPLAVVVITTFDLDEYVHGALRAGAKASCSRTPGPSCSAKRSGRQPGATR